MKSRPRMRLRKGQIPSSDEYKRLRRDQRMERTPELDSQVRAWAEQHGCSLRVLNDGHHWLFQKAGFTAEWWPSSAKLAGNRDYDRDHHAPHWAEGAAVLQGMLACQPRLPLNPGPSPGCLPLCNP